MDNERLQCDLRGAGNSYHVEYILNVPDGIEIENLTHSDIPRSYDDLEDDEIEIGWATEIDADNRGYVSLHILEDDDRGLFHRLSYETCFQLAELFRLVAERAKEAQFDAEAAELAEEIEIARQNQPLPFMEGNR